MSATGLYQIGTDLKLILEYIKKDKVEREREKIVYTPTHLLGYSWSERVSTLAISSYLSACSASFALLTFISLAMMELSSVVVGL